LSPKKEKPILKAMSNIQNDTYLNNFQKVKNKKKKVINLNKINNQIFDNLKNENLEKENIIEYSSEEENNSF
jgi:hypothetical protein